MNDVREVIERITARFEPASGLKDLSTRRDQVRTRRRVVAGAIAFTMVTGGPLLMVWMFSGRAPGLAPPPTIVAATWPASASATVSPTSRAGAVTDCPAPSENDHG
jgi:hypothetical protein